MTILFVVLIILASVVLGFIVLVQNPKGGGLAGNIAGFSNQFMGVKQTTDVLEKGTWVFAIVIAVLCITSTIFISGKSSGENKIEKVGTSIPQQQQQQPLNAPSPVTPTPNKK
jgi:preprotein translocase subunit SecG